MYPRRSAFIQRQVFGNVISLAIGISFSLLMFQVFTCITLIDLSELQHSKIRKSLTDLGCSIVP